ncbi:hypothetical protein CERSUDRAFT_107981 [Gelatoporia subvermispora B]|uniref:Uncharacterized protein n=1 Tax=Ceriporiopsis subvermispora (strain B) TaxID=914234 RepID=M2Q9V3_CERS8|nr:hypothetical protein CERSUDRAFT_107981 [Gelatoporia subvermispora B]
MPKASNTRSSSTQRLTKVKCRDLTWGAVCSLARRYNVPVSEDKDSMIEQLFAHRNTISFSVQRDRSGRAAATDNTTLQREGLSNETRPQSQAETRDKDYNPRKELLLRKALGTPRKEDDSPSMPPPEVPGSLHSLKQTPAPSSPRRSMGSQSTDSGLTLVGADTSGPVAGPSRRRVRYSLESSKGSESRPGNGPLAKPSQSTPHPMRFLAGASAFNQRAVPAPSESEPGSSKLASPSGNAAACPVPALLPPIDIPVRKARAQGEVICAPEQRGANGDDEHGLHDHENYPTFGDEDHLEEDDGGKSESDDEDPFAEFLPYQYPPSGLDENDPEWLWTLSAQLQGERKILEKKLAETRRLLNDVIGDAAMLSTKLKGERKVWQLLIQDLGKDAGLRFVKYLSSKMWDFTAYDSDAFDNEELVYEPWDGIPNLGLADEHKSPSCPSSLGKRGRDDSESSDIEASSSDASSLSSSSSRSHKRARFDETSGKSGKRSSSGARVPQFTDASTSPGPSFLPAAETIPQMKRRSTPSVRPQALASTLGHPSADQGEIVRNCATDKGKGRAQPLSPPHEAQTASDARALSAGSASSTGHASVLPPRSRARPSRAKYVMYGGEKQHLSP